MLTTIVNVTLTLTQNVGLGFQKLYEILESNGNIN